MSLHFALSILTCGISMGSLVTLMVLAVRLADCGMYLSRIERRIAVPDDLELVVEPKNPIVCAEKVALPVCTTYGSTFQLTLTVEPVRAGSKPFCPDFGG